MECLCSAVSDPCLRRSVRRAGALLLMLVREIVRGVFVGACVDVQLLSDSTACRGPPRAPGAGREERGPRGRWRRLTLAFVLEKH